MNNTESQMWNKLLNNLNLLGEGYGIVEETAGYYTIYIKKVKTNGDLVLIDKIRFIEIQTNRSTIKFTGRKIFNDIPKLAQVVHEKCNELFKKLANYEAEAEKEKQVIELAKRKLKTESDAKLKEMEILFYGMEISKWSYSEGIAYFCINDIGVKTYDMLTFRTTQTPYLDEDATKLLVDMYNNMPKGSK